MPQQRTILEGFGARTSTAPSPASATAAAAAATGSESRAVQAAARTRTDSNQTDAVDQTEPTKHALTLEESWRGCTAEAIEERCAAYTLRIALTFLCTMNFTACRSKQVARNFCGLLAG